MPFKLSQNKQVSRAVAGYRVTSFAIDLERAELHIGYVDLVDNGKGATYDGDEHLVSIREPEFSAAVARATGYADADVYGAIKRALYDDLSSITGAAGTIE